MADLVRVFVSHHHSPDEDAFTARLVADLETAGADVWVDSKDITSDDFIKKINQGLAGRQWFVLVMTPSALHSEWVEAEVNAALNQVRKKRMLGVVPIVAKPCDDADIPPLLDALHRYDATRAYEPARDGLLRALGLSSRAISTAPQPAAPETLPTPAKPIQTQPVRPVPAALPTPRASAPESGLWERLSNALIKRAGAPTEPYPPLYPTPEYPPPSRYPQPDVPERLASLGFRGVNINGTPAIVPPLVRIPSGPFMMNKETRTGMAQQRVEVPTFYLAKYPVTVAEYALAIAAGAVRPPTRDGTRRLNDLYDGDWERQRAFPDRSVACISQFDAETYIDWLTTATGQKGWRLPTEAEWQKAAGWNPDTNILSTYPWGDTFDRNRCNTAVSDGPYDPLHLRELKPVGTYPAGDPQRSGASYYGVEDLAGNVLEWTSSRFEDPDEYHSGEPILLGGSFGSSWESNMKLDYRHHEHEDATLGTIGFRLAFTPEPDS